MAKPAERVEWLAVRQPYFNASSTAILFDRHPFQSPGDYATVKLTRNEKEETRAMSRGRRLEDVIARWWAEEHDVDVVEPDELFIAGPIMATVDRFAVEDGWPLFPVEIKTTAVRAFEPERHWLDQCQSVMLCTGSDRIELVWFDSRLDIHSQRVFADPVLQDEILTRAERFMAAIELGIVPDWITLSYDNVVSLFPDPAGAVELDDDGLTLVRELDTLRGIRLEAEKEEKAVKDALARLLGDKEVGTWQGHEVLSFRAAKPATTFNRNMFAADHPDLYEKYMVPATSSRRMLPKLDVAT